MADGSETTRHGETLRTWSQIASAHAWLMKTFFELNVLFLMENPGSKRIEAEFSEQC